MNMSTARLVVSRTTAGGIAVREPAPSGRLLGYTVPGHMGWVACVRAGEEWAAQSEPTPDAAEKALRVELRMPERLPVCPVCEEEVGGPWCNGRHDDGADVTNWAELPDIYMGLGGL